MGISFGSIGTGLPKDIVQQIIKAEKIPLQKMEGRKSKVNDKKKLVQDLIELMEAMKVKLQSSSNERSLRELKSNTNEDLIGVSVDKNVAHPGNYQLEVVQLARKSSALTAGVEDPDETYMGVGYIEYFLPDGSSHDIYVDSDHSSLKGIAKLINQDRKNGMRANVINDGAGSDEPWRLVVSLEETGDGNNAEFPYFYFVDGEEDLYIDQERPAQDAKVKLDGFEVEVPGNKVKDLIPGVTLDLKKAKPGEEFTLAIGDDSEAITEKVSDIIEDINAVLKFIKEQNSLDENSDTTRTLGGDIILQTLESRLRRAIFTDVQTSKGPRKLSDMGISFQRTGLLATDAKKFNNIVKSEYGTIAEILTGYIDPEGKRHSGVIQELMSVANFALSRPSGLLRSRMKSMDNKITAVDRRISQRQRLINQKEKNLKNKFARLEETMARIKSQGAGIAALGASAQAANPVQQLG